MMSVEEMEALLYGEHFTTVPTKCPLFPKAISPIPHQTLAFDQPWVGVRRGGFAPRTAPADRSLARLRSKAHGVSANLQ